MIRHHSRRHFRATCRASSRSGVALIIVLAGIVLLAILIVSYVAFTGLNRASTASYSRTIQAQEIALGGLQDVLSDFHSEISAGSTGGGLTNSGVVAYIPASAACAQPARLGYTPASWTNDYVPDHLAPTLVRVSRASQDATPTDVYPQPTAANYPGGTFPINRASTVSTTKSYADGTYISAARWNKTYLLATNAAAVPTPFTAAPPDWVYVTRTGSRVCQDSELASLKPSSNLSQNYGPVTSGSNPPASPIVGRYAYVIYDEGALLDVNAAGSPSTLITGSPSAPVTSPSVPTYTDTTTGLTFTLPGKSSLASADLTQLPGLSGAQASVIDPFLKWRNYGSVQSTGTTGPNFLQISYTYARNGFVSFSTGDNPVLGRLDLIHYFTSIDPNINTTSATFSKALPYLGTFSRALNEPSWAPTANAPSGGLYNYAANAELSTASPFSATNPNPNRDIPNVRFTTAGTIKHYADDGTTSTYSVNAGDPLVQHRFSLAKLAWLTHTGIATSVSAQAVTDCFGLQWNGAAYRWDYYGSKTTPPSTIETLDQVAAENREPNFFELLKAGILAGSLGENPGPAGPGPYIEGNSQNTLGSMGYDFDSYSAVSDFQIIQIGVNIIDQARADDYPSAVFFNFTPPRTYPEGSLYQTAFGQKNLPYIQAMGELNAITQDGSPNQVDSTWLQPEVWNPNRQPATYPGTSTPTQLRIITMGQTFAQNEVDKDPLTTQLYVGTPVNFGTDATAIYTDPASVQQGEIDFSNSVNFFNKPYELTSTYGSSPNSKNTSSAYGSSLVSFTSNPFLAVWTGDVPRIKPASPSANRVQIKMDTYVTFILEYKDAAGIWMPYSLVSRMDIIGTNSWSSGNTNGNPNWKEFAARPDPRTDRFSVSEGESQGGNPPTYWPPGYTIEDADPANGSAAKYASVRFGFPYTPHFSYPAPVLITTSGSGETQNNEYMNLWSRNTTTASNANNSQCYYSDTDTTVRPGDAVNCSTTTGVGLMLNHSTGPSGVTAATNSARRPVVLDRPFRSVGELGCVFRDLPFKSLDFWSKSSADAALLDLFSVADEPQVVAGEINPSNAPQPVLQAVFSGTMKNEALSPVVTLGVNAVTGVNDAQALSTQISNQLLAGPLRNRADLASTVASAVSAQIATIPDLGNKSYGEAPVRALAPVANTRTWNLFIDLIAQAGQLAPNAASISDFVVQGERRYWLHIAVDRFTGKIIDQQLEPVYE